MKVRFLLDKKLPVTVISTVFVLILCLLLCACGSENAENGVGGQQKTFSQETFDKLSGASSLNPTETAKNETASNGINSNTAKPVQTQENSSSNTKKPTSSQKPISTSKPVDTVIADGEVVFDKPSGFYQRKGINITLKAVEGYDIYYTLDCSDPKSSTTAKKYSSSIKITDKSSKNGNSDKVSVIRAIAVKSGANKNTATTVYTETYLLNDAKQSFSDRYGQLAVFSINLDDEKIFGKNGIYTNYTEHGSETERQASIEFFETGGSREVAMDAGIRIYGGVSRAFAQKSFKLVARKEYSENGKFKYAFFDDNYDKDGKLIKKYDSLVLRAGGNDALVTGGRATALRDALAHKLALGIENISCQNARPVVVYLNGSYWGIYFLREDLDNDYLEAHYGVVKDNVAILSYGHENGNWTYKLDEGTESDKSSYINMISFIRNNDMSDSRNYSQASSMLDMDNLAKYMAIGIYLNNRDWPQNNVRLWKYNGTADPQNQYTDGKWRFMLKDIDYAMGRYNGDDELVDVQASATTHNENIIKGVAGDDLSAAFGSLLKNPAFRASFITQMEKVSKEYYSYEKAEAQIIEFRDAMKDEMSYHTDCTWGGLGGVSLTVSEWKRNISQTLTVYFSDRCGYIDDLIARVL